MDLQEYHCKKCDKLLCKGLLTCRADILEIKCRGYQQVCYFTGLDADIIKKRNELIRNDLIPDPEKD